MQNQMCDVMTELDNEKELCQAQIENKTSGMSPDGTPTVIMFLPHSYLLIPQNVMMEVTKQAQKTTNVVQTSPGFVSCMVAHAFAPAARPSSCGLSSNP